EHAGLGVEGRIGGARYRLGRPSWVGAEASSASGRSMSALSRDGALLGTFAFTDTPRADAKGAVRALLERGITVEIVSGDGAQAVAATAHHLGIDTYRAAMLPADKVARLEELR